MMKFLMNSNFINTFGSFINASLQLNSTLSCLVNLSVFRRPFPVACVESVGNLAFYW